jgi:hypothetical protein
VRHFLLLAFCLLLTIPFMPAAQELQQYNLPNPADYPAGGRNCQRRVKMSPWIGTPAVNWPETYQCVLALHTCDGVKKYQSGVRPGGAGMCDDYWKVHDALANREICCDQGSPKQKPPRDTAAPRPPRAKPASEPKYTDCTEEQKDEIAKAVRDAIDALQFSGCLELHRENLEAWRDRLGKIRFVCWNATTNQDNPPCAKAGKPRETIKNFSRNHITIFSKNIASCGCLHANIIHEVAHTFGYEHRAPRNAYELERDCAACGK